jgi:Ca2+-binding RTX toxin-like protein
MTPGTEDNDVLYGGNGKDKLYGEGGDDVLYGENGKDELYGGDGNDTLYGGNGKDTLYGNDGDDVLYLDSDNDTAFGGDGNDHFMFGFGDGVNEVNGGTGNTWIDVIELEGISSPPGGGDWTLQIEEGSVEVSAADHLVLSDDSAGTITLSDGSAIDFEGIERIEW